MMSRVFLRWKLEMQEPGDRGSWMREFFVHRSFYGMRIKGSAV